MTTRPQQMRATQYDAYGPADVLHPTTVAVPDVGKGQVLVKVAATSVNAADVLVRAGKLKAFSGRRFPRGTGFDFSGEVAAVGPEVTTYRVGDPVWGFRNGLRGTPSGAAAEYIAVPTTAISRRPLALNLVEAAALSSVGGAALGTLRTLKLSPGERVLVRGAAGGVGTAAVQIATALGGQVTALARAGQADRLRDLGAAATHDYRTLDPATLGAFDVIVDPVGKDLRTYRRLLAPKGRMGAMTVGGGSQFLYLAASQVLGGRRVRFIQSPPGHELLAALAQLVDDKKVGAVVDSVYPLDQIADAHRSVEAGGGFGKRVVQI